MAFDGPKTLKSIESDISDMSTKCVYIYDRFHKYSLYEIIKRATLFFHLTVFLTYINKELINNKL